MSNDIWFETHNLEVMWYPNLRQLEIFRSLMETKNVSETARRLNITQPAVSKVLGSLEARLETRLFKRSRGRLQARSEAERFAVEADRLLNQTASFNSGIRYLAGEQAGQLKIGAIPTLAECAVSHSVRNFISARPNVRFELHSQPAALVLSDVQRHNVELGFVYGPIQEASLERVLVGQTEIVCAMHPTHRLSGCRQLSPENLDGEDLIFLEPSSVPSYLLRDLFEARDVAPVARVVTNAFAIGRTLARIKTGIALIDKLAIESEPSPEIVTVPLVPLVHLRVFCVHSTILPLSDLASGFIEDMTRTLATNNYEAGLTGREQ